jgi:hypothetical protein
MYLVFRPKQDYTPIQFDCKCGCDSVCTLVVKGEEGLVCRYVCLGCREEQIVPFSGVFDFVTYLIFVNKGKVIQWRNLMGNNNECE